MQINGAKPAISLISPTLGKMTQELSDKRDGFMKKMELRKSRNKSRRLTYNQKEALFFLQEFGGVLGNEDKRALDGRALSHLSNIGYVITENEELRLTSEGYGFLKGIDDDEKETENTFRDRCETIFGVKGWQVTLSKALGVSRQTIVKWTSGKLDVPEYVLATLECLEEMKASGIQLPERFR